MDELDDRGRCMHCHDEYYEPPEPDYNAPTAAERTEMHDRARRMK